MKQLGNRQSLVPGFVKRFGLLSATTAMPCPSFSLPAGMTCPGRSTAADSVCNGCYARGGAYKNRAPADCQAARLLWTREALKTATGRDAWADTMIAAIEKTATSLFRWHDSGDVFNVGYAKMIRRTIQGTPTVRHWLPTRSWVRPAILRELVKVNAERNVLVRPSGLTVNSSAPVVSGLAAGTTVYTEHTVSGEFACPKTAQGLVSCDAAGCCVCFGVPTREIGYKYHPPFGGVEAGDRIRKDRLAIIKLEERTD